MCQHSYNLHDVPLLTRCVKLTVTIVLSHLRDFHVFMLLNNTGNQMLCILYTHVTYNIFVCFSVHPPLPFHCCPIKLYTYT